VSVAALLAAAALAGGPTQVVHPDGRIGQFRIGVTTKAQLLTALGAPRKTVPVKNKSGARRGTSGVLLRRRVRHGVLVP
jgi:hypothetical protein